MEITSSYGVEIYKQNIPVKKTLEVFRAAVSWLIPVYEETWERLSKIESLHKRFNAAEHLVHTTKNHTAEYDFDTMFPKMPSYLRRSAIQHALGAVSSYRTRKELWEKGELNGKPVLETRNFAMPVFYRENMYKEDDDGKDLALLKLYSGSDWVWYRVKLCHTDMEYLRKYWTGKHASAPTLEKKHDKYFLRFSFAEKVKLSTRSIDDQKICAVDLGINTDAVCSIMTGDGTVLARKFINFGSDKDRLYRVTGRIRRFQRKHGKAAAGGRWSYADRLNDELSKKIGRGIVSFAADNHCDVIVFEHLEMKGRKRGSRKQKLQLWRKRCIQDLTEHQAHRLGIRISRVNAWNTSALAYDGSGKVERDEKNHSICTFANGKKYNCDLSASYNIGARYIIREKIKPLSETRRSLLEAKVPAVKRRTSCVYADLIQLNRVLAA